MRTPPTPGEPTPDKLLGDEVCQLDLSQSLQEAANDGWADPGEIYDCIYWCPSGATIWAPIGLFDGGRCKNEINSLTWPAKPGVRWRWNF